VILQNVPEKMAFDCGLQKKRRDHHRNISMLCDEKAPSV
jgi:hypothetical protein